MHKNDLNRCFNEIVPTAEQTERMLHAILENRNEERERGKSVRRKLPLVAAIVICLAATTALAFNFGIHERLMEYFNVDQEESALLKQAVDTPEASIRKNGVTITVQQTIMDDFGIYILYEMTVPDTIELSDDIGWLMALPLVTLEQPEHASALGNNVILEQDAHRRVGLVSAYASSSPMIEGPVRLVFRDLGYHTESGDFVTLIEGEWRLSWEITQNHSGRTYSPNQMIAIDGKQGTIEKVSISPISFHITTRGDHILYAPISILFKDGSHIAIDESSGKKSPGGYLVDESNLLYEDHIYHRFYHAIDPDEAVAVIINDQVILLQDS